MHTVLHILTRPADGVTRALIEQQRVLPEITVEVTDLTATAPDYDALLEKIFTADSIQVS